MLACLFLFAVAPPVEIEPPGDEEVFLVVTINPEGRVKVARGGHVPVLKRGGPSLAWVKIENQSGGRQRLEARGTYSGAKENPFRLEVLAGTLRGREVEYRRMRITCTRAGKRELTIAFEAGQGTQDIGFRGETPVLFEVRP
jgi:hypothetical protein